MLHRKVQCWIFTRNAAGEEMCLLLMTNKARGGFWQPVTGTVEPGEGYFEAACREPMEETGFSFEAPPQDSGFEFDYISRFGPARERIFALTVDGMADPRIDAKEHQDFKWVKPSEALGMLRFPSNVDGLKTTYQLIFGKELR